MNQAKLLWDLQTSAAIESQVLSNDYADNAVAWLAAATAAAHASQSVRFGTVSEASNGVITYSPTPVDRLVIHASTGWTSSLTGIQLSGDTTDATFPRCAQCLMVATWSDASTALKMELGETGDTFTGSFVAASSTKYDVAMTTTSEHDVFQSGHSYDDFIVAGTLKTPGVSVNLDMEVFAGKGETGPFYFTTSVTRITLGSVTSVLDTYRGTFMKSGQTLPHLAWSGTVTQNGALTGGLEWRVLSVSATSKLVEMLFNVGSDSLNLGNISIDPTADTAYDSRHSP